MSIDKSSALSIMGRTSTDRFALRDLSAPSQEDCHGPTTRVRGVPPAAPRLSADAAGARRARAGPETGRRAQDRRSRGAQPRSPPGRQLPHALVVQHGLQPARALRLRAGAEALGRLHDRPRPRREVGVQEPDHPRLHPAQGRALPQQAAGERARGHRRGREVLGRAVHGQVRLPLAAGAGAVGRRRRPSHRALHAEGAVRAAAQPPRQRGLRRHPPEARSRTSSRTSTGRRR